MTLEERIEEREFKKRCKGYRVTILALLIAVGFLGGMYLAEIQRCANIKTTVISYDFERGRRELIKTIKEM